MKINYLFLYINIYTPFSHFSLYVGFFFEESFAAGIDKLDIRVRLVFSQHQNGDSDGGAVKQVGGERNHRFNKIIIHQVFADFLLRSATVKNTGEANNGGTPSTGEIAQSMEDKGKVCL